MKVLDWQQTDNPQMLVQEAVSALRSGLVVALPTETVYGLAANALLPDAVARLCQSKGRPVDKPLALALREPTEVLSWAPGLSALGRRLARRCWPGPLTLVTDEGIEAGRLRELPAEVASRVASSGSLGLRMPAHDAILEVLAQLDAPLVLTSANRSGEPPARTIGELVAQLGDDVSCLVDGGPAQIGQPSTVVRVANAQWEILREGALSREQLQQLTTCVVTFVCTGNTCRSPLAEILCKKMLADRLHCTIEELPSKGMLIISAGVAATPGTPAALEAIELARSLGLDLSKHLSRPLTENLLLQSDYVLTMTRAHLAVVAEYTDPLGAQPRLLSTRDLDIPDPIGGTREVYTACARELTEHLTGLVHELLS